MHRKSNTVLLTLGVLLGLTLFGVILKLEPWVIITLLIIVLVGGWLADANGMSGNP